MESLLRKYKTNPDVDALRERVKLLAQELMELEVKDKTGAERHERSKGRRAYRNGYREREWDTRVGTIPLRIPRLREGSHLPRLIEPRRRAERAVLSFIQEAYVHGVSTRRAEDVVRPLGLDGISKSEVSRICAALDEGAARFRERPLEEEYPYVWLDGKGSRSATTDGWRTMWRWSSLECAARERGTCSGSTWGRRGATTSGWGPP